MIFPVFAEVPAYPLVFVVFWGAAIVFALAMAVGQVRAARRQRRARGLAGLAQRREHIAGFHRRQLVAIADQHQQRIRRHRLDQLGIREDHALALSPEPRALRVLIVGDRIGELLGAHGGLHQ